MMDQSKKPLPERTADAIETAHGVVRDARLLVQRVRSDRNRQASKVVRDAPSVHATERAPHLRAPPGGPQTPGDRS
jgi:hypothetical protein